MNEKTKSIVGVGMLTALVVVLQMVAGSIRFGVFSITLTLVPIIVGAALFGWWAGAWLGFVFGIMALFDAGPFLMVTVPGTVITCILKGALAGCISGLVYKALDKFNRTVAVFVAAVVAPIVNTGVFLIGCRLFFYSTIKGWAEGAGFTNVGAYMIFGLVGVNFLVELIINMVLSSAIVRIIQIVSKPDTKTENAK